jgi:hypothetical protein
VIKETSGCAASVHCALVITGFLVVFIILASWGEMIEALKKRSAKES